MEEEAYFIYVYYSSAINLDAFGRKVKADTPSIHKITRHRKDMGSECKRIQVDFDPSKHTGIGYLVVSYIFLDKMKMTKTYDFTGFFAEEKDAMAHKQDVLDRKVRVIDKKETVDSVEIIATGITKY